MDELKKQAEDLGIAVDGRWSEKRLKEEIAKASGDAHQEKSEPAKEASPVTLPVYLLRNYRPHGAEERVLANTAIDLPREEAISVVEAGIARRNDAFGG